MATIQTSAVVLSTRLDAELAKLLRTRAAAADRTPAAELRRAVRAYLTEDDERRAHEPGAVTTSAELGGGD